MACIARNGFHQSSMHEICIEAGMSPGALYRYFPSKQALLAAIVRRHLASAGGPHGQPAADPRQIIKALAAHTFDTVLNNRALALEIMAEAGHNLEVAEAIADVRRARQAAVKDNLLASEVVGGAAPLARALCAAIDGIALELALSRDTDLSSALEGFDTIVNLALSRDENAAARSR